MIQMLQKLESDENIPICRQVRLVITTENRLQLKIFNFKTERNQALHFRVIFCDDEASSMVHHGRRIMPNSICTPICSLIKSQL